MEHALLEVSGVFDLVAGVLDMDKSGHFTIYKRQMSRYNTRFFSLSTGFLPFNFPSYAFLVILFPTNRLLKFDAIMEEGPHGEVRWHLVEVLRKDVLST